MVLTTFWGLAHISKKHNHQEGCLLFRFGACQNCEKAELRPLLPRFHPAKTRTTRTTTPTTAATITATATATTTTAPPPPSPAIVLASYHNSTTHCQVQTIPERFPQIVVIIHVRSCTLHAVMGNKKVKTAKLTVRVGRQAAQIVSDAFGAPVKMEFEKAYQHQGIPFT